MQQVLSTRPLSASWCREVLQFKRNFALSITLQSWIWLYLYINQLHHALLVDAVFYCFAMMKCLNPVLSHTEWHHSGWSIQHLLHSDGTYCTVMDPIALICSEALYGLQWAWKPTHFSYEQLIVRISMGFSTTGSTVVSDDFFFKQTIVFPTSLSTDKSSHKHLSFWNSSCDFKVVWSTRKERALCMVA